MTIYYFNEEKTAYFEGPQEDKDKFNPKGIIVSKRPGEEYWYNFEEDKWEKTISLIEGIWKPNRNYILEESAWLINSIDSPLSEEEKTELVLYRQQLIDLFSGDVTQKDFPTQPTFLKDWISYEEI